MKLKDILLEKKLYINYYRPPGHGPEKWTVYEKGGDVYFSGDEKHVQSLIAQVSDVGLDKSVELVKNARSGETSFTLNKKKWNDYKG